MSGVLDGIRVLDLTTVIMAPYATQVLGDLGADVIKVETGSGDMNRSMGGGPHRELSGIALNIHRNKWAITLDRKLAEGIEAFLHILDTADVFVTNLRPGPLRRLGISYADVGLSRPRLVYCQAQGFRSGSAEEDRPAYDDIIQAAVGMPRLSERTVGTSSFVPAAIGDKIAGQTIVSAVLAALLHRERAGRGQRVEVPMFDAVFALHLVEHLSRAAIPGEPAGYSRILTTVRGPHRTADGYLAAMPYTPEHWVRMFSAVGREAALAEPWFADVATRLSDPQRMYENLANVIARLTTAEWLTICDDEGIPASPVPDLDEILDDPALHRGMVSLAEHPVVGTYRSVRPNMILDDTPLDVRRAAPLRSQHTVEVLAEAGYGPDEIDALIASGAASVRDA